MNVVLSAENYFSSAKKFYTILVEDSNDFL